MNELEIRDLAIAISQKVGELDKLIQQAEQEGAVVKLHTLSDSARSLPGNETLSLEIYSINNYLD